MLFPVLYKAQGLIATIFPSHRGITIDQHASVGTAHYQRQNAKLAPAAFGDVVFLNKGVAAVVGYRAKVKIKGLACAECMYTGVPRFHKASAVIQRMRQ